MCEQETKTTTTTTMNWAGLKQDLMQLVADKRCGPILVRLSWHDAGTFCQATQTGGARACMRFAAAPDAKVSGEASHAANAGLDVARSLLAPIAKKYDSAISQADLWAYAAVVAIEAMSGPVVPFAYGRRDAASARESVEDGRLPDASQGAGHLRAVFGRMGLYDVDIVALSGAHTVGSCHVGRSGFDGPWTADPYTFDNAYFRDLLSADWTPATTSAGCQQFVNESARTMMLPSDVALVADSAFRPIVERFAADQDAFFVAFAEAFRKLQSAGYADLRPIA